MMAIKSDENRIVWNVNKVDSGLVTTDSVLPILLDAVKSLVEEFHPSQCRSLQYYDLIAGSWCINFLHVIYINWAEVLGCSIDYSNAEVEVANDSFDFIHAASWKNHFHENMKKMIFGALSGSINLGKELGKSNYYIKNRVSENNDWRKKALKSLSSSNPRLLITLPYIKCPPTEWAKLMYDWRKWASWNDLAYPVECSGRIDIEWRLKRVRERLPANNFEQLILALLPLYIPALFLEGSAAFRNNVLSLNIKRPKAVYSALGLHSHHVFKSLLAEWREDGTHLLYHQHGGCYGMDKVHTSERYEASVSNRFYTYGWTDERPNVIPLSPQSLSGYRASRKKWSATLLGIDWPRHTSFLAFSPAAYAGSIEIKTDLIDFLRSYPTPERLLIRPYPHEGPWGIREAMKEAAPLASFDAGHKRPFHSFAESHMVVHSYLSTGWLETISLNIPTVCFYDPNFYSFRPSAQYWIDKLERIGVLHRSGQAAAKFISNLGDDPQGWWNGHDVRVVIEGFRAQYANFSTDWKGEWKREFESAIDEYNQQ